MDPRVAPQVKEGLEELLKVGFIRTIEYPDWLANIVAVPKKNGKVRICIDFRDLNKATPKDDYPLPNIDLLIDSTAGHALFSFMDGYSGYNHIKLALVTNPKLLLLRLGVLFAIQSCRLGSRMLGQPIREQWQLSFMTRCTRTWMPMWMTSWSSQKKEKIILMLSAKSLKDLFFTSWDSIRKNVSSE